MLPLSWNQAFAWLRRLLSNYPTFSWRAAYFLPNKTCIYSPHLYTHKRPFSHCRRARIGVCWIKEKDSPLSEVVARARSHIYCNYAYCTVEVGVGRGSWKSKRKSDKDPYAMRGGKKEGRIVFQSAHATCASSLFATVDSSQRGEQTCKYPYLWIPPHVLYWQPQQSIYTFWRSLSLRCHDLKKASTNDLIKDAAPWGVRVCAWWTQRCLRWRAKINCVLFSSPVRSVYLYIDGCLVL